LKPSIRREARGDVDRDLDARALDSAASPADIVLPERILRGFATENFNEWRYLVDEHVLT
jgi:hypothetical protein